jgi:uncharacterized membrane protein
MTNGLDVSRLERVVGTVLRTGALASTALLAAGLALSMADPSLAFGPALTSAGLVVLIATPVARVVASVIEYAAERDWTFVVLTGTVLLILAGSLLVAITG